MSQRILDRAAILAAPDIQTEELYVPEWGGSVLIKGLTAAQRDQFEADSLKGKGKNKDVNLLNIRARFVSLCIVDEEGNQLFSERDVHALGQKSGKAIDRIWDKATDLSGISDDDVDELTKNSESDQSEGSSSD